jgi:hypothetical protein
MDGQRFDGMARLLAGELQRRGTIKALAGAALAGVATRATLLTSEAGGNFGDHCSKNDPCKDPLACINLECDNCRKEGDCQTGWCCKGYTCTNHVCVACSGAHTNGVAAEGCKKKKKRKRKKRH